jgi:hypothetical protein
LGRPAYDNTTIEGGTGIWIIPTSIEANAAGVGGNAYQSFVDVIFSGAAGIDARFEHNHQQQFRSVFDGRLCNKSQWIRVDLF